LQHLRPDCFLFYETYGKLANIVSDADDVDLVSEGALKQFVSREEMSFERKFKDPFTAKPTALLTVICNSPPKFFDKSDGIWRRLILIKIKSQVKDQEIDYKYIDSNFWIKSGELSGILNRALEGLRRIINRGKIIEIRDLMVEKNQYRYDLNPIAQYAAECCEFDRGHEEPTSAFYKAYRTMCFNNGNRPCAQHTFARQFKIQAAKLGHDVDISKPKRKDAYHGRFWYGVKLNQAGRNLCVHVVKNQKEQE
jgi:phage/plasmid-associated DNA primase